MRDRLVELLKAADKRCADTRQCENCVGFGHGEECVNHLIADHLLANGVVVPPCKVGDITYIYDYEVNNHLETRYRGVVPSKVEAIAIEDEGVWIENEHAKYHITAFGNMIFLTKEEAEQALKGGEG